ncbi:MAG: DUF1987 domain-containing protein [Bacteroidales bacterium]|nr:DUF1987 domain-containing protein [Bacteroidales bacterium]
MVIKQTIDTPYINLSVSDCKFEIKGKSYYVGINKLYDKVLKWVNEEVPALECNLKIEFYFSIISSASLKNIIEIINRLDYFYKKGKKLSIHWICDKGDIDILETAKDFSNYTLIPFNISENSDFDNE